MLKEDPSQMSKYGFQPAGLKSLISGIKQESKRLREVFITEEEQNQKQDAINFFDARMQSMLHHTYENLDRYQFYGWKEIIYDGDKDE